MDLNVHNQIWLQHDLFILVIIQMKKMALWYILVRMYH
jgi:hypothetical protein